MPPIVTILIVLGIAMLGVIMITSRNPTEVTPEQSAKYAKLFRIMIPVLLISLVIRYFFMG